jgi:flagellar FliJ protein
MRSPLAVLIDLAQRQCDDAAKALAARAAAHDEARQRGAVLERYRGEYAERLMQTARDGIDADSLREMRRFLARIDEAQAQQQRDAEACVRRLGEARDAWQAAQRRFEAFAALGRRREACRALATRRTEQRGQDEAAARRIRARAADQSEEPR